jgi:HAD domain in Swiss Army Knife RNA repair proteins
MVDIDGVISLFGGWEHSGLNGQGSVSDSQPLGGSFHSIDGTLHFLSSAAAEHLLELSALFELVWASGWEERANEHLPHLLGLPPALPFLRFQRQVGRTNAHWKLDAIDAYAGQRPLAWIDDAFNPACHQWAQAREARTLLVQTAPERGLTAQEARQLAQWAEALPLRPGET